MDLLLLAAACVASVWGIIFLRSAGLLGLVVSMLIAGTVFGHPFFHVSALTLDRALLVFALGIWAIQYRLGLVAAKRWNSADAILAIFISILALNVFLHNWRVEGMEPVSRFAFYYAMPMLTYGLARQSRVTPRGIRWLYVAMTLFGLYVAGTAVMERLGWNWAIFPRYIASTEFVDFLGRGRGPLLNPSGNGILLVLAMVSMLMLVPRAGRWGRIVLLVALGIYLLGIHATLTRCAWMGGVGALGLLILIVLPKAWRMPMVLSTSMALVLVVGANWERLVAFKRDKNVSLEDMKESASLRPILAVVAWKMFQDYPVFGCGIGHYLKTATVYLNDRDVDMVLEKVRPYIQHNVFLSLLTETGLVGLSVFTALIGVWTLHAWRLWRCNLLPLEFRQMGLVFLGTLTAYFANGMFQDVLVIPMVNMYLFFLAGLVQNLAGQATQTPARQTTSIQRTITPVAQFQFAAQAADRRCESLL